jgi:hypothetical protein
VRPRWRQWRLLNRRSGAMSGARDGPHELAARAERGGGARAQAKGVKKRAMGAPAAS